MTKPLPISNTLNILIRKNKGFKGECKFYKREITLEQAGKIIEFLASNNPK